MAHSNLPDPIPMSPSRSSSPAQPQSNTDTTNPDLTTQLPDTSSNRSSIFRRRRASFAGSFLFSDHDGKKRGHLVSAASTDSLKDDVLLRTKKDTNLPHEATTPLPPQQLHECRMMFGVKSKQTISDKLPFKPLSKRNSRALFLSIPAPTEEPEERTTSSNIFCRRKTICGPKTAPTENTPSLPDPSTYIDESTGFLVPPSAAPPTSLPPPIHKNLRRKSFFKLPSFSRSPHPTASELPESKVWSAGAAWSEAEALRQSDVDAPSPPPPDLIDRPPSTKSYEAEKRRARASSRSSSSSRSSTTSAHTLVHPPVPSPSLPVVTGILKPARQQMQRRHLPDFDALLANDETTIRISLTPSEMGRVMEGMTRGRSGSGSTAGGGEEDEGEGNLRKRKSRHRLFRLFLMSLCFEDRFILPLFWSPCLFLCIGVLILCLVFLRLFFVYHCRIVFG